MINITLNGEPRKISQTNIGHLIEHLALDIDKIAIEKNLEIVTRNSYIDTAIIDGDNIEIIEFVGGG